MSILLNGLYSPAGYKLALKVRDNCEFKSEAWEDAQKIVKEIVYRMICDGNDYMYCQVKNEIENLIELAENNPSQELDDQIDEQIDFLYCNNEVFYKRLREEVELPDRWKDED